MLPPLKSSSYSEHHSIVDFGVFRAFSSSPNIACNLNGCIIIKRITDSRHYNCTSIIHIDDRRDPECKKLMDSFKIEEDLIFPHGQCITREIVKPVPGIVISEIIFTLFVS